jgi:hypothetical protein
MDQPLTGGCACGAVRFTVHADPVRVGLCHCLTCRKAHASAFNPFVVFPAGAVTITGEFGAWRSSAHFVRHFCPACGSRVSAAYDDGDEIELSLGSFDQPGLFSPQYESWIIRREAWLAPLDVPQNDRDPAAAIPLA